MRSSRRLNYQRKNHRRKVNKGNKYKPNNTIGSTHGISTLVLENINEVLRVHKRQRADGKGAWKVVPKDSCEVYKDRQRRQMENKRRERGSENGQENKDIVHRKPRRRNESKRNEPAKKSRQKRRRYSRRKQRNSSLSSYTTTTTSTSGTSCTGMEYD